MSDKIFTILFVLFIGGFFLMHLFSEDLAFSEQENRVLTQRPTLTWKDFKSGKYTTEIEQYLSDQFPFKNQLVGIKGKVDHAIGKQENNGVLFGKEGFLLERFKIDGNRLKRNIQLLNDFAEQTNLQAIYALLPPTAIGIYPEHIPRYVSTDSQEKVLAEINENLSNKIQLLDVYDHLLSAKEQDIYFKTDHHWTTRGAYIAYQAVAKQMNITPLSLKDFDIKIVSKSFHGTLYSKATAYDHEPDEIELFIPKYEPTVDVTYEDGTVSDTLFEMSYLDVKDKYSLFLDGNHSLVKIKTDANRNRKLAVIKDSYAHAFIPLLAKHYDEIHVIDLRYYKESVSSYMADHGLDEMLLLYNLPNFTKDTNLGLLR